MAKPVNRQLLIGDPRPAGSWVLAEGHYVSTAVTGMLPTIIYPRPQAETNSDAYCKNAYTGMAWEIPIVVQGGSWPFRYQLITGPAGMTIGETLTVSGDHQEVGETYGVLSWASPTGTSESITVKVTDQDGNETTVSWTLTIGTSAFVFVDAVDGNDTTGDGTFGNPLKTIYTGIYKESSTDDTHLGKIVVLMGGTYLIGDAGDAGQKTWNESYKPRTYIGYPGETAILDASLGNILVQISDAFFGNLQCDDYYSSANNFRFFTCGQVKHRQTFYKLTFTNVSYGILGTDNCNCIECGSVGATPREYFSVVRCTQGTGTEIALFGGFDIEHFVVEHCHADGITYAEFSNGANFMTIKADMQYGSIRANTAIGTVSLWNSHIIAIPLYEFTAGLNQSSIEACWNTIVTAQDSQALQWNYGNSPTYNTHQYRNTIKNTVGDGSHVLNAVADLVDIRKEAIYAADVAYWPNEGTGWVGTDNLTLNASDIDSNGKLAGSARTTYLGTHGAEVA